MGMELDGWRFPQPVLGVFLKENVNEKSVALYHRFYRMGFADAAARGTGWRVQPDALLQMVYYGSMCCVAEWFLHP